MASLPVNFPAEKLSVVEKLQLEWFYTKFTEVYYNEYHYGHIIMAAYAAIPAYITPDMLYKIWQNFGHYQWGGKKTIIHSIAVSDVLLAPFCQEVSYELYRMDFNTRISFLKWMNQNDLPLEEGSRPIDEIAHFIKQYMQLPNNTSLREGERYRQEQLMEAEAYYNPEAVAAHCIKELNHARKENNQTAQLNLINKLIRYKEKETHAGFEKKVFSDHFNNEQLEIWKHMVQDNKEALKHMLSGQFHDVDDILKRNGITVTLDEQVTSYSLSISKTETKALAAFDGLIDPQTYIFIVPCSEADILNCRHFQNFVEKIFPKEKTTVEVLDSRLTIKNLPALEQTLLKITDHDNLIIYTSSVNSVKEEEHCYLEYNSMYIKDSEAGEIFTRLNPASFTLIIDGPDTNSPHWLNTDIPGYTLIATKHKPVSENNKQQVNISLAGLFERLSGQIEEEMSFRDIFTQMSMLLQREGGDFAIVMAGNRETYFQNFAGNKPLQKEVQHALRLCGYLNTTMQAWNEQTETAFQQFVSESNGGTNLYEVKIALDKLIAKNSIEQKPILLFIFSNNIDNREALDEINREINELRLITKERELPRHFEVKIFHNRRLAEIDQFVKSTDNRNRIQMVYYSGYDDNGNPLFNDGIIDLPKWNEWIYFHDRIELVVLNTCKTANLADQLTNIGVGMAIGSENIVKDDRSAFFGIKIIRAIADKNLDDLTAN